MVNPQVVPSDTSARLDKMQGRLCVLAQSIADVLLDKGELVRLS